MARFLRIALLISLIFLIGFTLGRYRARVQTPLPVAPLARPTPPTRDPNTSGYVTAKDLPDGANAPANVDGNFIIGPTHNPAPEMAVQEGVPHGTVSTFPMESSDSKIYPGIARDPNTLAHPTPPIPPSW